MKTEESVKNLNKVIKIDETKIKNHLGEMVRSTVEETLNDLQKSLYAPKNAITIGKDIDTEEKDFLTPEALKTHVHILGATMTGKSYFMELLLRQLIKKGAGCCLIDPHGTLYQHIVQYLCRFPELAKKVILFNPSEEKSFYMMVTGQGSEAKNEGKDAMFLVCSEACGKKLKNVLEKEISLGKMFKGVWSG